jgi:hypothetical protein
MKFDSSSVSPDQELPELKFVIFSGGMPIDGEDVPVFLKLYVDGWRRTFPLRRLVEDFAACARFPNAYYGVDYMLRPILDRIEQEAQCCILEGTLASPVKAAPFPVRPADYVDWFVGSCLPLNPGHAQEIEISGAAWVKQLISYFAVLRGQEEQARLKTRSETSSEPKINPGKTNVAGVSAGLPAKLGARGWEELKVVWKETGLFVKGPCDSRLIAWKSLGLRKESPRLKSWKRILGILAANGGSHALLADLDRKCAKDEEYLRARRKEQQRIRTDLCHLNKALRLILGFQSNPMNSKDGRIKWLHGSIKMDARLSRPSRAERRRHPSSEEEF